MLPFCRITSSYFMKDPDHRLNFCLPLFTHGCLQDPFALETGPAMRLNTLLMGFPGGEEYTGQGPYRS